MNNPNPHAPETATGAAADSATDKAQKSFPSGMAIAYGFLASIILTEYLRVASSALYTGTDYRWTPRLQFFALVLLTSFYLFYMIFDTLVWLVFYDKKPSDDPDSPRPRREIVLWLLCRCAEFFVLIWLYDFVNVLNDASKAGIDANLLPHLARLCFDIGVICLTWGIWFALFLLTDFAQLERIVRERNENTYQLIAHLFFGAIFIALCYWFLRNKPSAPLAFVLTYIAVIINVLRVYMIQKNYYTTHNALYRA